MLQRKREIGAVLVGDGRDRQHRLRHVDPLVVRQRAADQDLSVGEIAAAVADLEAQLAVIEQQLGSRLQRIEDLGMRQRRTLPIARGRIEVEAKMRAGLEFDAAVREIADP